MKHENMPKRHKGIYILPNIFTSMNIFCGFYAIVAAIDSKFDVAAIAILVAMVFDILDGKIARITNTTSQFGIEYDSLADVISFGLAPGLLVYLWTLKPLGRLGWLAAFLYAVCGALRLARFNSKADTNPSPHFTGLPIPGGAAINATTVLFCLEFSDYFTLSPKVFVVMLFAVSFLMVSTIEYNSFKKVELLKKINFNSLVSAILIFVFIAVNPQSALFLITFGYVLSGPVALIRKNVRRNSEDKVETTN